MNNLTIAWRNLWRNKRRTLITSASVFFGVLLAVIMSSMQEGSYENMIDNVVKFYSGYIQVHEENYWDNKTLYNSFKYNPELEKKISEIDEVEMFAPRLESFALASSKDITLPVMTIGVDPKLEDKITELSQWLEDGEYLESEDPQILLAEGLAKNLNLDTGDTVSLLSQGYYGSLVAENFRVKGILEFPSPELNKKFSYISLSKAQSFYAADSLLTSLALMVENYEDVDPAMKQLENKLESPYSVMSWDEMQPELLQMIESDRAGGMIMKGILYVIIAFGIFGTIMMMISERKKEMGVMVAVGMQKYKLALILFYETFYIGIIGVLAGFLASIPAVIYFIHNPIPMSGDAAKAMLDMGIEPVFHFSADPSVFINQVYTILIITLVISIYPLVKASRLKVIKALKS